MIRKLSAGDASTLEWVKSSYSDSSNGSECVEVAAAPRAVLVRDSKDVRRPHLAHAPRAWAAFVAHASRNA
ncbi:MULTISPECIES: DUF397 domain-containing protein [unclassified Streptomyces]|uniref:DUF397 domain-containing protein n=1 Tax=unclassified Streptomyces TaxID=2593676 RepID=UPI0003620F4E|nr:MULTISPECIES: DUF397 domain-containing protein [unclassified Streptomyces]MYY02472.1 DUF397 domain-containing protein [Streptomyces sp. SID4913]